MSEITKVVLTPYWKITEEEKKSCLNYLNQQAMKGGFKVELQSNVAAWDGKTIIQLNVRKIEPANKFRGEVDIDTEFVVTDENMDEVKSDINRELKSQGLSETVTDFPEPCEAKLIKKTVPPSEYPSPEPSSNDMINTVIDLIDDIEALRVKHGITYECLKNMLWAIAEFVEETKGDSSIEDMK